MPHFFANDVLGLVASLLLGLPVVALPGYFLGAGLNLLSFNSHPANAKWSLSVLFGIALSPILLYLPGRLLATSATWAILIMMTVAGGAMAYRQHALLSWKAIPRSVKISLTLWVFIGSASLLDVASSSRLYPSSAIIDLSYRSQLVASLCYSHHLPPTSFFFFPGHEVEFHYHYLLFLLASAFVKVGRGFITARIALTALIIWTGFALLSLVWAYIEFFTSIENKPRATRIGWLLLLVGGLDIVPFAAETASRIAAHQPDIVLLPDLEWWNRLAVVSSWYDSLIWQAHHVAGLIACFAGALLLWHSRKLDVRQRALSAIGAALAFGSAAGVSVLVTIVFVCFFSIVVVELILNCPSTSLALLTSGALALILIVPFLHELRSSSAQNLTASFSFVVRPFLPVTLLLNSWHVHSPLVWNLAFLLLLPINYLIELGVFGIAGVYWLYQTPLKTSDTVRKHLMLGLSLVSLLLSSFVYWGSEHSNDFGYRAILPAQFILLLWTIEVVDQCWPENGWKQTRRVMLRVLVGATLLGVLTNLANFLLMRSRVVIAEHFSGPAEIWPTGLHPAQLMYDLRNAYLWIREHSSPDAVVQQNPEPYLWIEKKLYSERMAAIQGADQDSRSGDSKGEFPKILKLARSLFTPGMEETSMRQTCTLIGVKFIIVQDSDPIWQDHNSYVWRTETSFQSSRVRVFEIGKERLGKLTTSAGTIGYIRTAPAKQQRLRLRENASRTHTTEARP